MLIYSLYSLVRLAWGRLGAIWVYRLVKLSLNIFYPFYCRLAPYPHPIKTAATTIISLTSFPARIDRLWLVIETLLRQTCKPYKVILWLAKDQFSGISSLPNRLQRLQSRGLEIRFCEDLRSHKKYFFTMLTYPSYNVITVDDDTFYPENLVQSLIECSEKNSGVVSSYLAHEMTFQSGLVCKYENWISGYQTGSHPSHALVPIGCGGVFYPAGALDDRAFDQEMIMQLCPLADDLWLKAMSTLNGFRAAKVQPDSYPFANLIYPHQAKNYTLSRLNNDQGMNDIQLAAIVNKYPELIEKWVIS